MPNLFDNLINDKELGPEKSKYNHYLEYVNLVEKKIGKVLEARVRSLMKEEYSIHFHVWTSKSFKRFLRFLNRRKYVNFEIIDQAQYGVEAFYILRKR